jgi:hypothetical protein
MLLCPGCHKLIDEKPEQFDVPTLRQHKIDHETRIHYLTSFDKDRRTTVVQVLSQVGGQASSIATADVMSAVAPRYPEDPKGVVVDLNQLDDRSPTFIEMACQEVSRRLSDLYEQYIDCRRCGHVSLFAIAPIPVLIHLGSLLSNKVPVDVYQRHRDTENWTWKTEGTRVEYRFKCLQGGTTLHNVALVLSLSGPVPIEQLPAEIDDSYSIYQLTLDGITASPTFLNQRADLEAFRLQYQVALRTLAANHPDSIQIQLFPAVPAPIAVLCGRELLPNVDPSLVVYDHRRTQGGFTKTITINPQQENV